MRNSDEQIELDTKFPIDLGHETRQEKLTRSGSDAKQFNSRYRSGRTDEKGKLRDMVS